MLAEAVQLWLESMPPAVELEWVQMVRRAGEKLNGRLSVASICTGCDVVAHVMESLIAHIQNQYSIDLKLGIVFQCERNLEKESHLNSQTSSNHLFGHSSELPTGHGP